MDVSIPHAPELEEDTYAYNLSEIKAMLAVPEPARTVVLAAALTGLRKSEIAGLAWENFDNGELSIKRSVWGTKKLAEKLEGKLHLGWGCKSAENEARSRACIPIVKQLGTRSKRTDSAWESWHSRACRSSRLGNGQPLNLDNLARRVIIPALSQCAICRKQEG